MRGFGVVLTGTLFSGSVTVGDQVEVYPKALQARVRGLQVHGESVEKSTAGLRTAVNLQGIERTEVFRGDIIGHRDELKKTYMLDVHLEHLADAPRSSENPKPHPVPCRDRRNHGGGYLSSDGMCSSREIAHLPRYGWRNLSSCYPETDSSYGVIRQSSR